MSDREVQTWPVRRRGSRVSRENLARHRVYARYGPDRTMLAGMPEAMGIGWDLNRLT